MVNRSTGTKVGVLGSALVLWVLCIGTAPSLRATASFYNTVTSGACQTGTSGQGSDGNSRCFLDSGGAFTVTATAWSTTGSGSTFNNAALGLYTGNGLGICNDAEVVSGSACTSNTNPAEHAVGNQLGSAGFDFILLTFDKRLTNLSVVLNPYGGTRDMDLTYFVGNCTSFVTCNPNGKTLAGLNTGFSGFSGQINRTDIPDQSANFSFGLNLSSVSGGVNWVLIGTNTSNIYDFDDSFKLYSVSTPEPGTFGLAGAALAAIGFLRARKKRPAVS